MGEDTNQAPSVIPMLTTLDEHNFYTAQQGHYLIESLCYQLIISWLAHFIMIRPINFCDYI